jgi:hypothetical protein
MASLIDFIVNAIHFLTYRRPTPRKVISAIVINGKVDREYDPKEYEAAK